MPGDLLICTYARVLQAPTPAAAFIGNVNASALARTRMAKSALDAGRSLFRTMLQ